MRLNFSNLLSTEFGLPKKFNPEILRTSTAYLFMLLAALLLSAEADAQGRVKVPTRDDKEVSKEDSAKYGAETTRFIYQDAFKYNRVVYDTLDTLIQFAHRYSRVEQLGNKMQYLGTLGTASRPIFPLVPEVSGATSGLDAYDIYVTEPDEVRYFNTLSPYSRLFLTFGGNNRDVVDVGFARNITPTWNVGASIRTVTADKQTGRASRGDRRAESYFVEFFTFFQSKNERYRLFGHMGRLNHEVNETGGVQGVLFDEDLLEEFFGYRNSEIYLRDFVNREFRFNYHIYHEYALNDNLQVYHEMDRRHQNVFFFYRTGTQDIEPDGYFRRILLDTAETADRVYYDEWDTEVGLKGDLGPLFYSVHYRLRNPQMDYIFAPDTSNLELYGGFDLRLELGEKTYLGGGADYQSTQNYRIEANFVNPILKAGYVRSRNLPSYMSQRFLGNHNVWENNFEPIGMDQLTGSLEYQFPNVYLRPFVTLTNVNQPVYYRRDTIPGSRQAYPVQADGAAQILSPGLEFSFDFLKRMRFEGEATYSLLTGRAQEAFAIPSLYASGSLYYQRPFLGGKIVLQVGTDFQLTPSYLAYDYDVATQQFFTQQQIFGTTRQLLDNFETPLPTEIGYVVLDAFINLKVRTAIAFLKVPYVNQGFIENGYFTTPYYVGQPRVFDLGIRWSFFD
jgi:hypothetical protein